VSGKTALVGILLVLVVGGGAMGYVALARRPAAAPVVRTLPDLVVGRGRLLSFTFADASGALQTVEALDEVPEESRDCVKVVDRRLPRSDRTATLVYVADLRQVPDDGRAPYRVTTEAAFEAEVLPQFSSFEMKVAYEPEAAPARAPVVQRSGAAARGRGAGAGGAAGRGGAAGATPRLPAAGPAGGDVAGRIDEATRSARAALEAAGAGGMAAPGAWPAPPPASAGGAAAPASPRARAGRSHRVTVYSTAWCPACAQARAWLRANQVAFEERDIERDPAAAAEYDGTCRAAGQRTGRVPGIVVDGRLMIGFAPGRLASWLGR
jgi:glutaredoxin